MFFLQQIVLGLKLQTVGRYQKHIIEDVTRVGEKNQTSQIFEGGSEESEMLLQFLSVTHYRGGPISSSRLDMQNLTARVQTQAGTILSACYWYRLILAYK